MSGVVNAEQQMVYGSLSRRDRTTASQHRRASSPGPDSWGRWSQVSPPQVVSHFGSCDQHLLFHTCKTLTGADDLIDPHIGHMVQ